MDRRQADFFKHRLTSSAVSNPQTICLGIHFHCIYGDRSLSDSQNQLKAIVIAAEVASAAEVSATTKIAAPSPIAAVEPAAATGTSFVSPSGVI